jgi:carbon-monoxide dehydrogenase large subunit
MTQTQAPHSEPAGGYVGARVRKRRGDVFLTGHARYINDIVVPGTCHAAVLRSPHAHARIVSIDTTRAAQRPGVLIVVDGDTAAAVSEPIPPNVDPVLFGAPPVPLRCLAVDKVHFYGQPVAAVVAETPQDAEAALSDIAVIYEPLTPVLDAERAMQPDAPVLYDGWTSNVLLHMPIAYGDVDAALDCADDVISDELRIQRYTSAPMETRGCIADWNPNERTLTYYGASQNPHPLRWTLARALRLAESQIRVVAPDVGGAFGLKIYSLPEDTLVALLSMLTSRPVKWIEDRRDSLVIGGREQLHRFTVGFTRDGHLTALRDHLIGNVGALSPAPGWPTPFIAGLTFPSGYKIPNTEITVDIVVTNKGQSQAVRGVGKEATALVMERIIDLVARRLGIDPAEVRRRNFISKDEFPYRTNSGLNIDSGDYHEELERLLKLIDYDGFHAEQERLRASGRYLGLGLGFELTPESAGLPATVMTGHDSTTVRVDPSGTVTVLTGVTTPGGGNDTAIAQIVADELGVCLDAVSVVQGDTGICPYGLGNAAGRSALTGGGSAALAARDIRSLLLRAASALLGAPEEDIAIRDGQFSTPAGATPVRDVVYSIYTGGFGLPPDITPPLESTRSYRPDNIELIPDELGRINPYPAYSNAVHASIVEVDAETGVVTLVRHAVVHDCGVMLNPALVEGQMRGATAMGIGAALMETLQYDEHGRLLCDQFKTYLLPRATDIPNIEIEHQVTPSPFSLLGTKGAGEAGIGGAQAAIANAVENALSPFGVTVRQMPLTPPAVLAMIAEASGEQR